MKKTEIKLNEKEKLTALPLYDLQLIQHEDYFALGEDSVALAEFAEILPKERVLEAGCGNGGLLLLLWGKAPQADFSAVEIMPNLCNLAKRNLQINGLEGKIQVYEEDFRHHRPKNSRGESILYDKIICNPPYEKAENGRISQKAEMAAAKFEIHGNLEEFFWQSSKLLKQGGSFYLVLPFKRFDDAMEGAKKAGLTLARKQMLTAGRKEQKYSVLLEFKK